MKIRVRFFAAVREITGLSAEEVEVPEGYIVETLLQYLISKHGEKLRSYLLDSSGLPKEYLQFLMDGKNVANMQGMKTALYDSCEFVIIPPVGGG